MQKNRKKTGVSLGGMICLALLSLSIAGVELAFFDYVLLVAGPMVVEVLNVRK